MKKVTKYISNDNTQFDTEKECINRDELIIVVDNIMSDLHPIPNDGTCDFANGSGYIVHDSKKLECCRLKILELVSMYIDHPWIQQTIDNKDIDASWVGRLLDEYNIKPLSSAWHRFSCMDKLNREWGQPYFANNPEKGEQINLSKINQN